MQLTESPEFDSEDENWASMSSVCVLEYRFDPRDMKIGPCGGSALTVNNVDMTRNPSDKNEG